MKIRLRTVLKGVIWEIIGLLIAFLVFKELKPIGIYFLIRIIIYYPYHMFWKKIKFHKYLSIKIKTFKKIQL